MIVPSDMTIRLAERGADEHLVWDILRPTVEAGDTFCADPDGGIDSGLAYFWPPNADVRLALDADGAALGCYYLKPNQSGGGAHVCNAGYCTAAAARGRGVARAMLAHSLETARAAGFRAMQYNFVVATNTRAIAIWQNAAFEIVGRLPGAFHHPAHGDVDALVMYRAL